MSRPILALAAVLLVVLAAGCGKSSDKPKPKTSASAGTTSTTGTSTSSSGGACQPAKPTNKGAQHLAKPKSLLPRNKPATLVLTTNCGEIDIALDVKRAPRTASSV